MSSPVAPSKGSAPRSWANKFGPPGWQRDPDWRGWWGDEPPFHSPVLVLTHTARPPLEVGETTFVFTDAPPEEALAQAFDAGGGLDVRIGGGPTTVRSFMSAGLLDLLHVVQVPILLGRGVSLWVGLEGSDEGYDVASTTTPSGVTHLLFERS